MGESEVLCYAFMEYAKRISLENKNTPNLRKVKKVYQSFEFFEMTNEKEWWVLDLGLEFSGESFLREGNGKHCESHEQ